MTLFFGFGMAPSMFPASGVAIVPYGFKPQIAKELIENAVPCLNPSHKATIDALHSRYGISVKIPESAPTVKLEAGDALIVMTALGLPRLQGRHEYTQEEIDSCQFRFVLYAVVSLPDSANFVVSYDNGSGYREWACVPMPTPVGAIMSTNNGLGGFGEPRIEVTSF